MRRIVRPRNSMAMRVSLGLALEDGKATPHPIARGSLGHVGVTNVSIVSWIFVDAIIIVGSDTISIVIVGLTVLYEAAHDGAEFARVKVCDCTAWPPNAVGLSNRVVDVLDTNRSRIVLEYVFCYVVLILGLALFVPVGSSIVVRLVKLFGNG